MTQDAVAKFLSKWGRFKLAYVRDGGLYRQYENGRWVATVRDKDV